MTKYQIALIIRNNPIVSQLRNNTTFKLYLQRGTELPTDFVCVTFKTKVDGLTRAHIVQAITKIGDQETDLWQKRPWIKTVRYSCPKILCDKEVFLIIDKLHIPSKEWNQPIN